LAPAITRQLLSKSEQTLGNSSNQRTEKVGQIDAEFPHNRATKKDAQRPTWSVTVVS